MHRPPGIKTAHNLRDMGGIVAQDGRRVRRGMLYRSGHMAAIAGDDLPAIRALRIDSVVDLRANDERARHPTAWPEGTETELWARDYSFSSGSLHDILSRSDLGSDDVHNAMVGIYERLHDEQAESFAELFKRLAAGRVPLLFNCSAGKDRTGVAAALILSVIGVDEAAIVEDYLVTNAWIDALAAHLIKDPRYSNMLEHRRAQGLPLLHADSAYLDAAFGAIAREYGSVAAYVAQRLGVDQHDQATMREMLLEA